MINKRNQHWTYAAIQRTLDWYDGDLKPESVISEAAKFNAINYAVNSQGRVAPKDGDVP